MNIRELREQQLLTQEELAIKAGISVRTLQRIEAGQQPKGNTAKVIAEALQFDIAEIHKSQEQKEDINITWVKLINISSLVVIWLPLLNIILPFAFAFWKKQFNQLTKQIISLQVFWTILSFTIFIIAALLKNALSLTNQFTLWILIILILLNLAIILINTYSLDRKRKLQIKLNFSFI